MVDDHAEARSPTAAAADPRRRRRPAPAAWIGVPQPAVKSMPGVEVRVVGALVGVRRLEQRTRSGPTPGSRWAGAPASGSRTTEVGPGRLLGRAAPRRLLLRPALAPPRSRLPAPRPGCWSWAARSAAACAARSFAAILRLDVALGRQRRVERRLLRRALLIGGDPQLGRARASSAVELVAARLQRGLLLARHLARLGHARCGPPAASRDGSRAPRGWQRISSARAASCSETRHQVADLGWSPRRASRPRG